MAETKPLASLSSGLLARKGQARPAMRRQGLDTPAAGPVSLDDLGWNDMGDPPAPSPAREAMEHLREVVETPVERTVRPTPALALTPEPASPIVAAPGRDDTPAPDSTPVRVVPPIAMRRARRQAQSRLGRTATGKAAFTLRLDAERHLKLRLAAALERRSAQALVTDALDQFLDGLSGLDDALDQMPGQKD